MKRFYTDCVSADGDSINDMMDMATDIDYDDFRDEVDSEEMDEIETRLGYGDGLKIRDDWSVSFHKSEYQGKPCVFFRWSAIEHVFI